MPPTRLQLLAVESGNAEAIGNHELFSDDGLKGIVIDADEAGEELGRRVQTEYEGSTWQERQEYRRASSQYGIWMIRLLR